MWVRILVVHRYGSIESSVGARRVPSGQIGHIGQSSVRSQNIKCGPKWVENRPFGPKQRPNEPNRLCGPIRTTPEAQKRFFVFLFLGKRPPAAPADLGGPPHSYRRRPGPMYLGGLLNRFSMFSVTARVADDCRTTVTGSLHMFTVSSGRSNASTETIHTMSCALQDCGDRPLHVSFTSGGCAGGRPWLP